MARDYSEVVRFKGYFTKCLYPKNGKGVLGKDDDHRYGITKWEVEEEISGDITYSEMGNTITLVGEFYITPDAKTLYTVAAKKTSSPKYGIQYEVIYINQVIDLENIDDFKEFLTQITTQNQRDALYEKFENPLEIIAKKDIEALTSVKGIGPAYAAMIIQKYEEKKDDSELFIKLNAYGITPAMMNKLKCTYGSNKRVIEIMETNPYRMVFDVDGVGFKTADKIALNSGIDSKSIQRISAFIYYLLSEELNCGNSYITAIELNRSIIEFFGGKDAIYEEVYDTQGNHLGNNIELAIKQLELEELIGIEDNENKSRRRVFLIYSYKLESQIAWNLERLLNASTDEFKCEDFDERISAVEEKQGFKFSPEQIDGIRLGLENNVCFISGLAGCVDGDTEFFTGSGWKKIKDYQDGDLVLQWEKDGHASLVRPLRYIKQKNTSGFNVIFNRSKSIYQILSDNHIMIYKDKKGGLVYEQCVNFVKKHNEFKFGHAGYFITNFKYDGPGIQLSDDEIRLMIAVHADGHFDSRRHTNMCRISIKKPRKIARLIDILNKCNIEYKESICSGNEEGYHKFYFKAPIKSKHYSKDWYNCSSKQKEIILNEVLLWDGSGPDTAKHASRMYYSSSISDANFIQFVFASCGFSSSITIDNRVGKPITYGVSRNSKIDKRVSLKAVEANQKEMIKKIESIDGFEYCFNVPSEFLVLRCNNRIFITHNCGKSTLLSGILGCLEHYSFAGCSLSGKAAARIQEVTGVQGFTIHKLLGWNPMMNGFTYGLTNQLPYDIIVLDEVSMVGGDIFLSLLKAIRNGAKLIMLGDQGQLESIGALNIATDMFNSKKIPTVNLTEVHRQKAGGIITVAHDVRFQRQVFNPDALGIIPYGEDKQDMIFDLFYDGDMIRQRTLKWFEKGFNSNIVNQNISDIQIISPVKERGDSCVFNLNLDVQEYLISKGYVEEDDGVPMGFGAMAYKIHVGDKVLCIKNNYHAKGASDGEISIFNGWNGQIKEIFYLQEIVRISFDLADEDVYMSFTEARNHIILGYACTCHKLQGSQAKVVIGVIDYSTPPSMLTCQLLYTLITRATKRCIVVGQNSAIRQAISTNFVSTKRTFLPELLEGKEVTWRSNNKKLIQGEN